MDATNLPVGLPAKGTKAGRQVHEFCLTECLFNYANLFVML